MESVTATEPAFGVLLELFDDIYLSRSDGFGVYLQLDQGEQHDIEAVVRHVVSRHELSVLQPTVAPSVMSGPELALTVNAPTSRLALRIANDVWQEIRQQARLSPALARVVDIIAPSPPPCGASEVLDAFTTAITEEVAGAANDVMRERMRYPGGLEERVLAGRCLTSAARVLRRSVGQQHDPRPISDGEAASGELMPVSGLSLDPARTPIKRAVQQALDLAADRLGPIVGGEIGSFRREDREARQVEQIRPSSDDLVRMAELAGKAVGIASRVVDVVDAVAEVRTVAAS